MESDFEKKVARDTIKESKSMANILLTKTAENGAYHYRLIQIGNKYVVNTLQSSHSVPLEADYATILGEFSDEQKARAFFEIVGR